MRIVLFAVRKIFNRVFDWFESLLRLTDEEQNEAGIHLGDQQYK